MGAVTHVRVCWPEPDKVCLEGGCAHCRDQPWQPVEKVRKYAQRVGMGQNFEYGMRGNHGLFGKAENANG